MRRFLRAALANEGYQVTEAETGQVGLRLDPLPACPTSSFSISDCPTSTGLTILEQGAGVVASPDRRPFGSRAGGRQGGGAQLGGRRLSDQALRRPGAARPHRGRSPALRSALKDAGGEEASRFRTGDLSVDLGRRLVEVRGQVVHLTPIEYRLLATFVRNAGKVLTHRYLLREVWGLERHRPDALSADVRRQPAQEARRRSGRPAVPGHRAGRGLPAERDLARARVGLLWPATPIRWSAPPRSLLRWLRAPSGRRSRLPLR